MVTATVAEKREEDHEAFLNFCPTLREMNSEEKNVSRKDDKNDGGGEDGGDVGGGGGGEGGREHEVRERSSLQPEIVSLN